MPTCPVSSTPLRPRTQPLSQKLERMRRAGGHVPPADRAANKRLVPDGYLDLQGVNDYLDEVARQYPDLAMRVDSRDFEPGLTYEGRPLPLLKLSRNVTANEDEPVYLLNGAHHAREIVTPHLVMDAVRRLTEGYGTDAGLTEVLDTRAIIIAPVWNPDGYEYVWNANNMWRKNRKPVGNTYGVDQNRNYPFGWDNSCSGSSVPSSETYKGPSPASEEETLTMIDLQARYNVAKLLDYHSYGREVLIGFNCEPTPALLESFLTDEANELADLANYATRAPSGDGQNQGWALATHTTYSFLVETQTEFQPDFDEAEAEAERVWPLTRAWLERPIPLRGHITAGGEPVAATINIREFNNELFTYRSDAVYGSYHIILPNGNYTLDVAASGFGTRAVQVSIDNSNPKTLDIQL